MVAENSPLAELPTRKQIIQQQREAGRMSAAVFPIHYPRALFRAFDIQPIEVWGPPGFNASLGDDHIQQYACSIVRSGLAFILSGKLAEVDFIVVPNTCDSLQGLGSSLLDFHHQEVPVLVQYIPRTTDESAITFFADELHGLYERLSKATGKRPSDVDLLACITREEAADALLARLLDERMWLDLDDVDFYTLVRSREFLPAEDFSVRAEATLAAKNAVKRLGVPIVLSGIVPEPKAFLSAITDAGAVVAGDDLACSGRRRYPPGTSNHPFRRMAEHIIKAPPDSTRCSPVAARIAHLRDLVARAEARNVVFFDVKFCEPEQFYLPQLRKALEADGIRSIAIEVELSDPLPSQAITQLEALLEMSV